MKIELRNISKWFGKLQANKDISMVVESGTIQGIIGENGAGKSTLMKVLSGFIQADEGEILIDDQPIKILAPSDAIKFGIGMLHQDPLDFPSMKVIDNFVMGQQSKGLFPDRKTAAKEFSKLAKRFDFQISPNEYVDSITVGERQQLEIMRLLWLGVKVLILDEPTTGISAQQKAKLMETLLTLAKDGLIILYVSHKLEEVEYLCNQTVVMRAGEIVGRAKQPYSSAQLVDLMFENEVKLAPRTCFSCEDCLTTIEDLTVEDHRLQMCIDSLQLKKGEVIGLAGMDGSGQRLLLHALAGLIRPNAGSKIFMDDRNLCGQTYREFMKHGVAFVPADRIVEGLIPLLSLEDHFVLADDEPDDVFIDRNRSIRLTEERIKDFDIRGRADNTIEELSGGNQQRALLALLKKKLSLILIENPTRGLDVESQIYIWGKLKNRCKESGTTILFTSADLEEILQYSDRVLVFFGGKVSDPLDASSTDVDRLGMLIGGRGFEE